MSEVVWQKPEIVAWTQIILNSYRKFVGSELIERTGEAIEQSKNLYFASVVVVSHGTQADPILNYGNQTALDLWEMSWDILTQTSSRLTAEPMNREERQQMLLTVENQGFIDNYRGVRISSTGKRFYIEQATVWNLIDAQAKYCGQAAKFSRWNFLT
jgi:hypothetical protein